MVAYSFKSRFVEPIMSGAKRQTVRADRRRHARPGEPLQLYTGMRTRHCRLIGRATCIDIRPVTLIFAEGEGVAMDGLRDLFGDMEGFARADGFASWAELSQFWRENHPGADIFDGVLIRWGALDG
jgi:hypothetical protein